MTTHLKCLAGLELHQLHKLSYFTRVTYSVDSSKDDFTVQLGFDRHPVSGVARQVCYYYELVVLLWRKGRVVTWHSSIEADWVSYSDVAPTYAFVLTGRQG